MNQALSCADARMLFALLLYGELSFDEEERVDSHLDGCAECRTALEREKSLHAAFDGVAVEPAPSLLRECRTELAALVRLEKSARLGEVSPRGRADSRGRAGWWDALVDMLSAASLPRTAGAVALVALGFLGARLMPLFSQGLSLAGASPASIVRVSDVEAQADGSVRIVVDETSQRSISGSLDDQNIRNLLLEAVRDPGNAGLREVSAAQLSRHAQSVDIRGALVYLVSHDPNDGVRLRAMEGLKSFAAEPDVRGALSQVLLSDANPGVRTQAIDLLIPGPDDRSFPNIDRAMIGTLQEMMLHESNPSVRQRCQRVLEAINASAEIY